MAAWLSLIDRRRRTSASPWCGGLSRIDRRRRTSASPWCGGLILLLPLVAAAQPETLPERPSAPVTDLAGALTLDERREMAGTILEIERRTGAQVAVAVVPSLAGLSVEDYAERLFRRWGVGRADRDDGVLVLLSTLDRRVRIEVGYGLEEQIPDGRAGAILDSAVPALRRNAWGEGLRAIVAGLDGAIRAEVPMPGPAIRAVRRAPWTAWAAPLAGALLFLGWLVGLAVRRSIPGRGTTIAGLVLFGALALAGRYTDKIAAVVLSALGAGASAIVAAAIRRHRCPECGGWMTIDKRVTSQPTEWRPGRAEFVAACTRCKHGKVWYVKLAKLTPYTPSTSSSSGSYDTSSYSSSSGSSFDGFGGGSSGGGGASRGF